MTRGIKVLAAALLLLVWPASAAAHGSIFTFQQIDGSNLIMVTHNVHDAKAGAAITYNLRLYNLDGQLVPFQHVEAEIKQHTATQATQTLSVTPTNDANLTHTFPRQGNYRMRLAFIDNGKVAARADFPIVVEPGIGEDLWNSFFTLHTLAAFIAGAGSMALARKHRGIVAAIRSKWQPSLVHLRSRAFRQKPSEHKKAPK